MMSDSGHNPLAEQLPRPIGFVFSGGVSLGAVQVGMLRAVMERGIEPDFLIGSSAGSLNAAFMAVEYTTDRLTLLEKTWSGLEFADVFGDMGIRRTVMAIVGANALASPEPLGRLIHSWVPATHTECAVPIHVVATTLLTGQDRILSDGPLRRHLLASTAIPFVFPEVELDGLPLVDGSVSAHVPLTQAEDLGARTLVVFDVGSPCRLERMPENPLDRALHLFSIMLHHQPSGLPSLLGPDLVVLYLPAPCPVTIPPYDFSHADNLMEAGYQTVKTFLTGRQPNGPGIYRFEG